MESAKSFIKQVSDTHIMRVPIQYKIISINNERESDWKYWDIELTWWEKIVYNWAVRKQVYPSDISFLDRTLCKWERRVKEHEVALFAETSEGSADPDSIRIFVDFCDPNPEYRRNEKLFQSVHDPDVDRQIRAIAMMDFEE